jgi:drug/metabolite transporter (DMT)-like permease
VAYRVPSRPRWLRRAAGLPGGNSAAVGSCCFFCVVGPALIFLNKYILSSLDFPFPIFLTVGGLGFSSAVACAACWLGVAPWPSRQKVTCRMYLSHIAPVGLLTGVSVWLGNLAYVHLGVAYIQMLKALTPVVVYALGISAGMERHDNSVLAAVCILVVGPLLCTLGEARFSLTGFIAMMLSVVSEGARSLMQQHILSDLRFGVVEGVFYICSAATAFLLMAFLTLESTAFVKADGWGKISDHPLPFIVAALLAFGVNFAGFLVIKHTSSLTLKVLVNIRNAGVLVAGALLLREPVAVLQMFAFALSSMGTAMYSRARAQQPRQTGRRGENNASPVSASWHRPLCVSKRRSARRHAACFVVVAALFGPGYLGREAVMGFADRYWDVQWLVNLPIRVLPSPFHGWHVYSVSAPVEQPCPVFDSSARFAADAKRRSVGTDAQLGNANLTVCAMFKNQAQYLPEWLEFHLQGGVDFFLLYDDGSSDQLASVLEPYIHSGVVELVQWPPTPDYVNRYYYNARYNRVLPPVLRELERLNQSLRDLDYPGGIEQKRKDAPLSYISRQFSSMTDCGRRVTLATALHDNAKGAKPSDEVMNQNRWLGIFDVDEFMYTPQFCASKDKPQPLLRCVLVAASRDSAEYNPS